MIPISSAYAQDAHADAESEDSRGAEAQAEPQAGELHEGVETHGGGAHDDTFPPFDTATWGSQLIWLAITFGALFYLMSRVVLPRVAAILENRSTRISNDLAAANTMKEDTDAAIAAYEQALAEARQNAHTIAQTARDETKAEIDADRARTEARLQEKLDEAEARIAEVKSAALAGVDAIARDATGAMVEALIGGKAPESEVAAAVEAALSERS